MAARRRWRSGTAPAASDASSESRSLASSPRRPGPDLDRFGDILETMTAGVGQRDAEALAGLGIGLVGHRDAAGRGHRLQPDRDVDVVAEHLVFVGHHVAHVDAHAEVHGAIGGQMGFRSAITVCIAIAASMAPTMLGNSSRKPSPVFLTSRPP